MKRLALLLFLLAAPAFGQLQQNIRWDWQANTVTGTGQMLPVLALPGAYVNFYTGCSTLPCSTPAPTYTGGSGTTTCPSNAQVVWQKPIGSGCKATADSEGNFGGWFQAGTYQYVLTISGHQNGPYDFTVGGGSGGGGNNYSIQVNGVPLTSQPPANFTNSASVTFSNPSGNVVQATVAPPPSLSITTTNPIKVNSGNGPVSSGTADVECPTCGEASLNMSIIPPIPGQFAVVYPTGGVIDSDPPGISNIFGTSSGSGTTAGGKFVWECAGLLCSIAGHVSAHWTGFTLPSYINPANVTAIYADAITSSGPYNQSWQMTDFYTGTAVLCNGQELMVDTQHYPYNGTEVSQLTSLTGANFNSTAQCNIQVGGSGPGNHAQIVNIAAIRFLVYYTGTPPPPDTALHLQPPIGLNQATSTLYIDEADLPAGHILGNWVAFLPPASSNTYTGRLVIDGASATDCTVGGGSFQVSCYSNGSTWTAYGGGGGSGTYTTEVLSCSGASCTLSFTPTTFMNLSINGLTQVGSGGTPDFTRSGTAITLTVPVTGGDVVYAQYYH